MYFLAYAVALLIMTNIKFLSDRYLTLMVILTVLVIILKIFTIIKYLPLAVDGGWTAYPALSISRGGKANENTEELNTLKNIKGIAVKYNFDTRSVRLYPLSVWYKIFGSNLYSCRIYSILEYLLLITVVYFFLLRFNLDRKIVLIILCLYATDKTLLSAIADLRPDIFITMLTMLGFILFDISILRNKFIAYWLTLLTLSGLSLVWPYTAVSLSLIFVYFIVAFSIERILYFEKKLVLMLILIAIPVVLFFLRSNINDMLFDELGIVDKTWRPALNELWAGGVWKLFYKEIKRWSSYFLNSNVVGLLVIIWALGAISFKVITRRPKIPPHLISLSFAALSGLLVLLVADKHHTGYHAFAVVPFLFGIVTVICNSFTSTKWKRVNHLFLSACLSLSIVLTVIFSLRTAIMHHNSGYINNKVSAFITGIMPEEGESILAIGPTALFPSMSTQGNFTMLDDRTGSMLELINPCEFTYILIDHEYVDYGFERKFKKKFNGFNLKTLRVFGDSFKSYGYLKVLRIENQFACGS